MVKIVQFGEGNFLRTFVDHYFDCLNKEGFKYSVDIVKPIVYGSLDKFKKQNNNYHIVLRGVENGEEIEQIREINVLDKVISPFEDMESYIKLSEDKELKIIVSNTTEAGICFNANDKIEDFQENTYPAKLTKFLYNRFNKGLEGLYIMPVELIDNNADELYKCVNNYINLWNLPKEFKIWNDNCVFYCNTLVDRIVSGFPKTEEDKKHIYELIRKEDELVSIGEPFGLWAVEDKGNIKDYIKEGFNGINVVLTKDISYYKKRKVRVLNGSHTNIVPIGLIENAVTVYDCMKDKDLKDFMIHTLESEIVPYVSENIEETKKFAYSVLERFENPYLNHLLTSISLNSISKWKARNLPSFKDYYEDTGKIPSHLTIGFSYLIKLYSSVKKENDKYFVYLKNRKIELLDNLNYLEYFTNKGNIKNFMSNKEIWGEDLTEYNMFYETVVKNLEKLNKGLSLIK